jgi:hypothetical protein
LADKLALPMTSCPTSSIAMLAVQPSVFSSHGGHPTLLPSHALLSPQTTASACISSLCYSLTVIPRHFQETSGGDQPLISLDIACSALTLRLRRLEANLLRLFPNLVDNAPNSQTTFVCKAPDQHHCTSNRSSDSFVFLFGDRLPPRLAAPTLQFMRARNFPRFSFAPFTTRTPRRRLNTLCAYAPLCFCR